MRDNAPTFTVVGDNWEPSDALFERLADLLLDMLAEEEATENENRGND